MSLKKLLSVVFIFALVIGMTACGDKKKEEKKEKAFEGSFEVTVSEGVSFDNVKLFKDGEDKPLGEVNKKTDNHLTYSIDKSAKGKVVVTVGDEKVEVALDELYKISDATIAITESEVIVKYNKDKKPVELKAAMPVKEEAPVAEEQAAPEPAPVQQVAAPAPVQSGAPAPAETAAAPADVPNQEGCITDGLVY